MKIVEYNTTYSRKMMKPQIPFIVVAILCGIAIMFSMLFEIVPVDADNISSTNTETADVTKRDILTVTYVDVGQGNCTLIHGNGEAVMIDTGMYTEYKNVQDALNQYNITNIDCLVLTHPDAVHISGAYELIEDSNYTVERVMQIEGIEKDTTTYEMVQDAIEKSGINVINPAAGETYQYCGATFKVIGPVTSNPLLYEDINSYSIVLRMDYGETSCLFTGDSSSAAFNDIIDEGYDFDVDVYTASHHGSYSGSFYNHPDVISMASPQYAIISCGENNDYGHPHIETLSYLDENNVETYRTDKNGNIILKTDGTSINWYTER